MISDQFGFTLGLLIAFIILWESLLHQIHRKRDFFSCKIDFTMAVLVSLVLGVHSLVWLVMVYMHPSALWSTVFFIMALIVNRSKYSSDKLCKDIEDSAFKQFLSNASAYIFIGSLTALTAMAPLMVREVGKWIFSLL